MLKCEKQILKVLKEDIGQYYSRCESISYLFIFFFWLHWLSVAAHRLSLVVANGSYSSLLFMGFSVRWLLLLQSTGSRRAGFSS